MPASQGSEVERSIVGGGGSVHSRGSSFHEEQVSKQASSWAPDHSVTENHGVARSAQKQSNEQGNVEMSSVITDHKVNYELKDDIQHHHHHLEHSSVKENMREVINRSRERAEVEDHHDRNERRNQPNEAIEWVEEGTFRRPGNVLSRHLEVRGGSTGQSPKEPIKIDKDKVKAALEKRRKARSEMTKKKDVMDEDDLIERELEDGIELAAEDGKGQERRLSWPKTEQSADRGKEHDKTMVGKVQKGQLTRNAQVENPEEGEMFEEASSMPNSRKRKGSPQGKRWQDYS